VRVPFWYAAVFDPKYNGGEEFLYLDRVIGWCKKHGIYVLIDLHGAPGGQNTGVNILGENVSNKLWFKQEFKDKTVLIWQKIAARYKNEKAVVGYDLLNEAWGAPSLPSSMKDLIDLNDRLYKEIRKIDPQHMIFIEDGLQGINRMPHPAEMGWKNVVYSFHYYPSVPDMKAYINTYAEYFPNLRRAQLYFGVPFHLGEFSSIELERGGASTMRRYSEAMRRYGWAWNWWSFKKLEDSDEYNWGITGRVHNFKPIDLDKSSYEEIKAFIEGVNTERLGKDYLIEGWLKDFAAALAVPDLRPRAPLTFYPEDGMMSRDKQGNLRVEWGHPVPNFGWWGDGDYVLWKVDVPETGDYDVILDFAFGSQPPAKPTVGLWVDWRKYAEFPAFFTGDWSTYKKGVAATVKLAKGVHYLKLVTVRSDQGVINVRSLQLKKAAAQGKGAGPQDRLIVLSPLVFSKLEPAGHQVGVEWQNSPGNMGHWLNGESVTWEFETESEGLYHVSFQFSTPNEGSRVFITANGGGSPLEVSLPASGEWHKYQRVEAGKIPVKAGRNTLTFRCATEVSEGMGNLGEIILERM